MCNRLIRQLLRGAGVACFLILIPPAIFADSSGQGYVLQPGDRMFITVWNEPALDREVLILPDHSFSYPLVGIVDARGKSASDLREHLTEKIDKYIPAASVTVSVIGLEGNRIYVIGKVNNPGVFPVVSPIDVLQALGLAGGLAEFAKDSKIKVIRRIGGKNQVFPFDYGDAIKGKNLEANIVLKSGDVVAVP